MHALLIVVWWILAVYVVGVVVAWRLQERVVYQPPRGVPPEAVDALQVTYTAADGTELFAYVAGERERARRAIIAFHGNADLARWLVPWAVRLAGETSSVVLVAEYRGYDGVAGRPTYKGLMADAIAARSYVEQVLGVAAENTIYFGHSLGTAVATELALLTAPSALVLESPFTSASAMARRFPVPGVGFLWPLIARVHYDTVRHVAALDVPVWVVHGDRDVVVPLRMGQAVFGAARNKGELLIVRGAGHNDVSAVGGSDYWSFMRRASSSE